MLFFTLSSSESKELIPLLDSLSMGEIGDFISGVLRDSESLWNSKTSILRAIYKRIMEIGQFRFKSLIAADSQPVEIARDIELWTV